MSLSFDSRFFKSRNPSLNLHQSRSPFLWKITKTVICARHVKKHFKIYLILFFHITSEFHQWTIVSNHEYDKIWRHRNADDALKRLNSSRGNSLFDFLLLSLHFTDQRLPIRGKSVCRKFWWVKSDYYDTTVLTPCRFLLSIESVFSSLNRFWWNVVEN